MAAEAMLQLGILILTLSLFFVMHSVRSQTTQARTRTRNKTRQPEPSRHLVQATRHLARARSAAAQRAQHARSALVEADQAISTSPKDPSAHILRARSLNLMGRRAAAIKSFDSALSPPAVKSLSAAERADALVERAELKMAVNMRRRVDSAMVDLTEAMRLSGSSSDSVALCLLGQCYEWKGMKGEAEDAFRQALDVDPDSVEAHNGLDRVRPMKFASSFSQM